MLGGWLFGAFDVHFRLWQLSACDARSNYTRVWSFAKHQWLTYETSMYGCTNVPSCDRKMQKADESEHPQPDWGSALRALCGLAVFRTLVVWSVSLDLLQIFAHDLVVHLALYKHCQIDVETVLNLFKRQESILQTMKQLSQNWPRWADPLITAYAWVSWLLCREAGSQSTLSAPLYHMAGGLNIGSQSYDNQYRFTSACFECDLSWNLMNTFWISNDWIEWPPCCQQFQESRIGKLDSNIQHVQS